MSAELLAVIALVMSTGSMVMSVSIIAWLRRKGERPVGNGHGEVHE